MTNRVDESQASAYIDGELNKKQTKQFENELLNDEKLLHEVAEFAELKDKIKSTYTKEHSQQYKKHNSCDINGSFLGSCKQAVAATLVLAIGLFTFNNVTTDSKLGDAVAIEMAQIKNAPNGFKLTPVKFDQNKLLLHISSSDEKTLEKAMVQAESLLSQYETNELPLQLEIIANSGGVDLMRASVSKHSQKIKELQERYEKVQFVACVNTLKRLSKNGENIQLLPGVTADLPVVDTIIGRIQTGWTYIKI